ncbi:dipeptidase [Sphingopyxis macrogoltabida]|uniref:Dipeptidase n=1 Tax=Sphingopyxis macrogoltabida TaxID=33050 RepID=A0AAC9AZ31_SPHMC|nr:membrane dipeptidase [Sphingopyxis macrogoltabida]ALJ15995.1 dipeptidase [Sphingopyxis macrogoltabida]AMU92236.1 dipeptidase [Sphingopyxis macrogoltabida]
MPDFSRRQLVGSALAATVAAPFISRPVRAESAAYPPRTYPKRVVDLVNEALVIDMLHPILIDEGPAPMTDKLAEEYRTSGVNAILQGVGIRDPEARDQVLSYYALWGHYVQVNSHVFTGVDKMADILRAKRDGKVAVIMGMQNADHFQKVEDVEFFYKLGQRVSQLTYNWQNRLGSGSTERVDGGITDYGVAIIEAMNKVGMLIDVSHSGDKTTLDAIELSPKPIAITHSNCRALNNHPRLKTDEAIKALAAKGGVFGIAGVRNFVTAQEPTTLPNIVDHIDHAVKLVGIEHVGIGSDLDNHGYDDMPPELQKAMKGMLKSSYAWRDKIDTDGFDHPRRIYDLTEELMRRRYSNDNIKAILGGNFQRLLTATWGG